MKKEQTDSEARKKDVMKEHSKFKSRTDDIDLTISRMSSELKILRKERNNKRIRDIILWLYKNEELDMEDKISFIGTHLNLL